MKNKIALNNLTVELVTGIGPATHPILATDQSSIPSNWKNIEQITATIVDRLAPIIRASDDYGETA